MVRRNGLICESLQRSSGVTHMQLASNDGKALVLDGIWSPISYPTFAMIPPDSCTSCDASLGSKSASLSFIDMVSIHCPSILMRKRLHEAIVWQASELHSNSGSE